MTLATGNDQNLGCDLVLTQNQAAVSMKAQANTMLFLTMSPAPSWRIALDPSRPSSLKR